MKKITKNLGLGIILSLILVPLLTIKAETSSSTSSTTSKGVRLQNLKEKLEDRAIIRASSTIKRLENREDNIERIRAKIASTTASTTASSTRRLEMLDKRLAKQQEKMNQAKERLINKELKMTEVLGNIAEKIQERITILEGQGLNMTAAKSKLAEAVAKIEDLTMETNNLANLLNSTTTATSSDQLFVDIRTAQEKIKIMARETQSLLVNTVKEITKVLPKKGRATTTATSTI